MNEIGGILLFASLLVNLVAAPYYYRKLHRLIESLQQHDPETYKALHKPSLEKLGYKMSPYSSMSLVSYVWKKLYFNTNNSSVIQSGEKAFIGLVVSFSATGVMFLGIALIMGGANVQQSHHQASKLAAALKRNKAIH